MRPIEIIEKLNIFKYDETLPALLCQSCLYRLLDAYNLQQLAEASERRIRDFIGNSGGGGGGLGLCGISINSINQDSSTFSSTAAMGDSCKDAGVTAAIYANICDMFERNNVQTNNVLIGENGCMVTGEDMLNDIEIDVSSLTRSEANGDTLNEVFASKHTNFGVIEANQNQKEAETEKTDNVVNKNKFQPITTNGIDVLTQLPKRCSECGKVFKNTDYLEAHGTQCPCQRQQSCNLLLHQRTNTGERRFQCEICANFFTTSSNLKAHKATHLEHREYHCSQCKRDFKTLRELRRHEPVHKTVKDNVCENCQKAFTKRSYLMDHIAAMHRGIRRHKCLECGKVFGRRSNLVSHIRIHSGEKPFQCKFCAWKFNQSSALARHMKKHTKSKDNNFGFKTTDQVLKNSSLINILQPPEAVEARATDINTINISPQSGFNVLSNISNLDGMHCMNTECLNADLGNVATNTGKSGEVEILQSNGEYDFTKNGILNYSASQQMC